MSAIRYVLSFCLGALGASLTATQAKGQSSFVNLNFEAANLPTLQPGQWATVSTASAFPGWAAYVGSDAQSTVLYNLQTLGSAAISILGPNYNQFGSPQVPIEGRFMAVLMAGAYQSGLVSASLSQTGAIPADSRSIRLTSGILAPAFQQFAVSLDGIQIPMELVETTSSYGIYAGDVSKFAGQAAELKITSKTTPQFGTFNFPFDSVEFSPNPVPEPATIALLVIGLGSILLGCSRLRRRVRSRNFPR